MNWPKKQANVKIESFKHDDTLNKRWESNDVLFVDINRIIGMNHHTIVTNHVGAQTQTVKPALFYFDRRTWFNVVYIMDGVNGYYYCNISSPLKFNGRAIQYIDYDIDIIVKQDFSYQIMDIDEYEINCKKYHYSEKIQQQIKEAVKQLEKMIMERDIPFQTNFIQHWQQFINNKEIN